MAVAERRTNILIVDDESIHRRLLINALVDEYDLSEASDGQQAMELARSHPPPDLILLDVIMPGSGGHEICARLKADPATRDIPIIFVTIVGDDTHEEAGFRLGAVDYITKPIRPAVVRARVQTHLELDRHRRHLARLVEERTRELVAANERAMVAEAVKRQFLACMSHELRTPLTGIIGMASLLADTPLEQRQREYLALFHKASAALMNVLGDILTFIDLSSGNMELNPQEASPRDLIGDVVDALMATAVQRGNRLQVDVDGSVPETARLDPVRFRQVLLNLLSNAVKFTENGEVSLKASVRETAGGPILNVAIADTGIGMTTQQIETAFGAFNKLGDRLTGPDGTGLGLTNANYLIDLLGGELEVESEPGKGTRTRIRVPFG